MWAWKGWGSARHFLNRTLAWDLQPTAVNGKGKLGTSLMRAMGLGRGQVLGLCPAMVIVSSKSPMFACPLALTPLALGRAGGSGSRKTEAFPLARPQQQRVMT